MKSTFNGVCARLGSIRNALRVAATPVLVLAVAPFALCVPSMRTSDADAAPKVHRHKAIIRQTGPATCGPAALATLLTFYFDDPVTEQEISKLTGTDKKTMSSLRELRDASRALGYKAEGVRGTLPAILRQVETSGVPVIVHFKEPTQHYVLVVGHADDFILVSDPARGEVSLHRTDFLRRWDNFALIVNSASRKANGDLIERRRRSAETRLQTLRRANSMMAATRF
jgi:hypothetical protein